jgi:hypothetical protein
MNFLLCEDRGRVCEKHTALCATRISRLIGARVQTQVAMLKPWEGDRIIPDGSLRPWALGRRRGVVDSRASLTQVT